MVAIRWADHAFEALAAACKERGTPLVRLPAGYGVNRTALEILKQASGRLG